MAPRLTHSQIQDLLGAYALDAVDSSEAAIIDAHLMECPRCRGEIADHREAAALLAFSGADAPDHVWFRIAADLDDVPPPISLTPRLNTSLRRPIRLASAAAAVAAGLIGILGVRVVHQDHRIDQLASISKRHGLDQAAASAAVSSGAHAVHLRSDDGASGGDAVVLPDGHGYLIQTRLPRLAADRTYQLWGVIGAQTISLGVLGNDPALTSFTASGPLTALAITIEHAGGAVAPTTPPIVQGFVA